MKLWKLNVPSRLNSWYFIYIHWISGRRTMKLRLKLIRLKHKSVRDLFKSLAGISWASWAIDSNEFFEYIRLLNMFSSGWRFKSDLSKVSLIVSKTTFRKISHKEKDPGLTWQRVIWVWKGWVWIEPLIDPPVIWSHDLHWFCWFYGYVSPPEINLIPPNEKLASFNLKATSLKFTSSKPLKLSENS